MGILDFFSREAGQERRRALDSLLSQFIPPTARPQFNLLGELNPVVAMERAGQDAQRIGATQGWERVGATGDMLSNMAGVVAPALALRGAGRPVAQAVEEGLLGFSTSPQGLALGDFVADESGALRLWHASPHDFDRFSLDARLHGVGDQAFGEGHYFADTEAAGRGYLARVKKPSVGGRSVYASGLSDDAQELVWKFLSGGNDGTLSDVAKIARADLEQRQASMPYSARRQYQSIIDELEQSGDAKVGTMGRLYEVNVSANPEDFLDWDAPSPTDPQRTVGDVFRERQDKVGRRIATQEVADQGYRGITYGVGRGENARRDYVVFDDKLIDIVKKYGIAGAAAMLGVNAIDVEQAMAQGRPQPQGLLGYGVQ